MCLISKHFFPKIAKTDIICYKQMIISPNVNGKYTFIAPYTGYEFDDSIINNNTLKPDIISRMNYFFELILWIIPFLFYKKFDVCGGFIHAYAEEPSSNYAIFKCHIPKGALYYEEINKWDKSYAASVLVIDDMDTVLEQEEKRVRELACEREKYAAQRN